MIQTISSLGPFCRIRRQQQEDEVDTIQTDFFFLERATKMLNLMLDIVGVAEPGEAFAVVIMKRQKIGK